MGKLNGQLRMAGMGGVVGVDLMAALSLAEILGFNKRMVVELLPYVEAGMIDAMNKTDESADLEEEGEE